MNGIIINVGAYKVPDNFEMVRTIVRFIVITKNLVFSDTEIFALTYFITKGYNKITREELVSTKLLKTSNAAANLISKFRKYGILVKTSKGEELIQDFNFYEEGLDVIKFEILVRK